MAPFFPFFLSLSLSLCLSLSLNQSLFLLLSPSLFFNLFLFIHPLPPPEKRQSKNMTTLLLINIIQSFRFVFFRFFLFSSCLPTWNEKKTP